MGLTPLHHLLQDPIHILDGQVAPPLSIGPIDQRVAGQLHKVGMSGGHPQHLVQGQIIVDQACPGHRLGHQGTGRGLIQKGHVLVQGNVEEDRPVIAAQSFQTMGAHKDEAQPLVVLHQVAEEGEDGRLQLARAHPHLQLLELVEQQQQLPLPNGLKDGRQKEPLKGTAGPLLESLRHRLLELKPLILQSIDDRQGEIVEEVGHSGIDAQRLAVHVDRQVGFTQPVRQLLQEGGLAHPALADQHQDVLPGQPGDILPDELKELLPAKEEARARGQGGAGGVGIGDRLEFGGGLQQLDPVGKGKSFAAPLPVVEADLELDPERGHRTCHGKRQLDQAGVSGR